MSVKSVKSQQNVKPARLANFPLTGEAVRARLPAMNRLRRTVCYALRQHDGRNARADRRLRRARRHTESGGRAAGWAKMGCTWEWAVPSLSALVAT